MKKIKCILLFLLFLIALFTKSFSQVKKQRLKDIEAALPVIDSLFKAISEKNHLPGSIYGLVVDGRLIHTFESGFTDLDKNIPVTTQSAFRIASMTKSFTAMAFLKLRDQGKLKLDDPAYLYIPELKNLKYLTTDAAPITIRHLLTHAAGFPEDNPWGDRQLAVLDEEMIAMIKKGISFSTNPGTAYEYSNMGYALLGYIIKKVSGLPFEKYITSNILLPLGMTHTYWDYTDVPAANLAKGYRFLNNKWVEQPMLKNGAYGAMGGMITTIDDFTKYVNLHLTATPPSNTKEMGPVNRSSVLEMQHLWNIGLPNPKFKYADCRCHIITGYGYGLRWTQDCEGKIIIGHSGGLPGFGSDWKILPDYGIGVITFANHTYAPAGAFNTRALDTLVALANLKPKPIAVSNILDQRKSELIKLLPDWTNAESSSVFAENFFLDYFPDSLRKEATAIFKKAGKIKRVSELVAQNNLRGSFIMEGENLDIEIFFTLTPENPPLIQQYSIKEKAKTK